MRNHKIVVDNIEQIIVILVTLHAGVQVLDTTPAQAAVSEAPLRDGAECLVFVFVDLQAADRLLGFVSNFLYFPCTTRCDDWQH